MRKYDIRSLPSVWQPRFRGRAAAWRAASFATSRTGRFRRCYKRGSDAVSAEVLRGVGWAPNRTRRERRH